MLYVAVGLATMFGILIFFGLNALNQATSLVFQERLSTARTIGVIIERDLLHVSTDARGSEPDLVGAQGADLQAGLDDLMRQFRLANSYAFFHASGVQVLDGTGRLLATDGVSFDFDLPPGVEDGSPDVQVLAPLPESGTEPGFAAVATRIGDDPTGPTWIVVQLAAHNSPTAFVPSSYDPAGTQSPDQPVGDQDPTELYHLEVMAPDGTVVLAIGENALPGELSRHFAAIGELSPLDEAVALRHVSRGDDDEADHVLGVVPLGASNFTLVLEQPIDVALALPISLRRQLLMGSVVGFVLSLVVAWFTTKAVAKPTQQLTLAAKRMAQGDLESPIEVTAIDEVGTLVDSLESMRQQTRRAYQAVEDANRDLESRVRERTAELGELLSKIISAQEDERFRLARELHDDTAQTLGALAIALDRARDAAPGEASSAHLAGAKTLVTQLLQDTRRLILDLRPMVLDDMGLAPAIRWLAESRLDSEGIAWTFDADRPDRRLDPHIETALFRIAQEAMTNVVKHSRARHVGITVSIADHAARIVVTDDGSGFDPQDGVPHEDLEQHVGIAGMRERVALLRGRMDLRSEIGTGTTIDVEIPLTDVPARTP